MVQVRQQLVYGSNKLNKGVNPATSITIHETANRSRGANAAAHANLQSKGNVRQASWHYQVDESEAVQSFTHDARCWHAGTPAGNNTSLGIEICVNEDGDFLKAVHNAADLTAALLIAEGLSLKDVVQHGHWSGKNCPTLLRSGVYGIDWDDFLHIVSTGSDILNPPPAPAPAAPTGIREDGIWGSDTTTRAQQLFGTPADGEVWFQYPAHRQPGLTSGWVWNWSRGCTGSALIKAMQNGLGLDPDGVAGPDFWHAFQGRMGTHADGEIWSPSPAVEEFQRRLNRGAW